MIDRRHFQKLAGLTLALGVRGPTHAGLAGKWAVETRSDRVLIRLGAQEIATYVFRDKLVKRPYFKDLHTALGTRLTRHYPPDPATESTDHATMHPGLWLAFGRLNGQDYWRNQASVQHVRFLQEPAVIDNQVRFSVINGYLLPDRKAVVCEETAEFIWKQTAEGVLLSWSSTFTTAPGGRLELGHQEEMGLGVRLASPLCVKNGQGQILNSHGGVNEKGTWGKQADWWAASMPAQAQGQRTGVQITARSSTGGLTFWGHTRDYGLIVANPSPRPDQRRDAVVLQPGEPLKMQFTVRLFDQIKPRYEQWATDAD